MDIDEERKLNYRELQAIAKKLHLPCNLKYHLLIEVIEARRKGNEEHVQRILLGEKVERAKRRKQKLDEREDAYRHLQIPQERRALGRPRKYHGYSVPEKMVLNPIPMSENYIRSMLAKPPHSIQELLMQAKVPAGDAPVTDLSRFNRIPYYNQGPNVTYDNFGNTQATQENYQQHFMAGGSIRESNNMQYMTRDQYNSGTDMTLPVISNSNEFARPYEVSNPSVYDEYTRLETNKSFQMRDILNNGSLYSGNGSLPQYQSNVSYPSAPGYSQGETESAEKYYPSAFRPVNPSYSHNWVWETPPPQDITWCHYNNQVNSSCQYSNNRPLLHDPNSIASPCSDTLSAPEHELESLLSTNQESFPDFKINNNQLSYPLIYNYVASTEGQIFDQPLNIDLKEEEDSDGTSKNLPDSSGSSTEQGKLDSPISSERARKLESLNEWIQSFTKI